MRELFSEKSTKNENGHGGKQRFPSRIILKV